MLALTPVAVEKKGFEGRPLAAAAPSPAKSTNAAKLMSLGEFMSWDEGGVRCVQLLLLLLCRQL